MHKTRLECQWQQFQKLAIQISMLFPKAFIPHPVNKETQESTVICHSLCSGTQHRKKYLLSLQHLELRHAACNHNDANYMLQESKWKKKKRANGSQKRSCRSVSQSAQGLRLEPLVTNSLGAVRLMNDYHTSGDQERKIGNSPQGWKLSCVRL